MLLKYSKQFFFVCIVLSLVVVCVASRLTLLQKGSLAKPLGVIELVNNAYFSYERIQPITL